MGIKLKEFIGDGKQGYQDFEKLEIVLKNIFGDFEVDNAISIEKFTGLKYEKSTESRLNNSDIEEIEYLTSVNLEFDEYYTLGCVA